MCWATKNTPIRHIAQNEFHVLKIVNYIDKHIISMYYDFEYELGKLYVLDTIMDSSEGFIDEGFHSYLSKMVKIKYFYSVFIVKSLTNNVLLDIISQHDGAMALECIIPAGTEYYINEHGEVVSDKIIPIKLHELLWN